MTPTHAPDVMVSPPGLIVPLSAPVKVAHSCEVCPGVMDDGVAVNDVMTAGSATTTVVDPACDVQVFTVIVTLYVPASAMPTPDRMGFCCVDEKEFGPVQLYVAEATVGVDRVTVPPTHAGPSLEAVGVGGVTQLTLTVVCAEAGAHGASP